MEFPLAGVTRVSIGHNVSSLVTGKTQMGSLHFQWRMSLPLGTPQSSSTPWTSAQWRTRSMLMTTKQSQSSRYSLVNLIVWYRTMKTWINAFSDFSLCHLPKWLQFTFVSRPQADFKLMCDNAMLYNRPETVYYKAAKKLLHTGFKMMSKVNIRNLLTLQDISMN